MGMSRSNWTPRRFQPWQMEIIRLYWRGLTRKEIADRIGCTLQTIARAIDSTDGAAILEELRAGTISTTIEAMAEIQAVVPEVLEQKISLALHSADERVRSKSCTELLEMAGHSPIRHIQIERPDPLEAKYGTKTEEDLRRELLDSARKPNPGAAGGDRGPDGNLVN